MNTEKQLEILQSATPLPLPTDRAEVAAFLKTKNIPPLPIILDFQERYGAREIYAHSIGTRVTLSIVKNLSWPPAFENVLIVQGSRDIEGKWMVGCGQAAMPNFIDSGSIHLHEDGALLFNYKPWASSVERWLMTEALAREMQEQGPWYTTINTMVSRLVDLGKLTGLPRLTEDTFPYTTWWGDDTVRIQTGSVSAGHNPRVPLFFVRLFAHTNEALLAYLGPIQDALKAVSEWKMDRRDWRSGTWPETVTGDS